MLHLSEDFVPNPVVLASFHPMIIAAVECVVTQLILGMVAVDGTVRRDLAAASWGMLRRRRKTARLRERKEEKTVRKI